jgi:leucyl-tRNA synthetase
VDKTVLANEQVDTTGKSWRSGAKVEQRMLKQWLLATTHFAEELYSDLLHLGETKAWPPRVVDMQKNWLGRSSGIEFPFDLEVLYSRSDASRSLLRWFSQIRVFTTRLDTLSGVQFIALALNHPLVMEYAKHDSGLQKFISTSKELPASSKAGYILPFAATNSLLGAHRASVYVAPYVLDSYGTGAVMGVPAHDARDNAFWRSHRKNEAIRFAIRPRDASQPLQADEPFLDRGVALHLGTPWDGLSSEHAETEILRQLQLAGYEASERVKWRLRDWLISRQRYWGAPIPIIHCDACGTVPVPLNELPVVLPKVSAAQFASRMGNPLEASQEWASTECPQCHGPAKRETDTMDTFMDSAWYFFRFADPDNQNEPVAPSKARALMPVDFYVGGVEHAILHLLYARFIAKFLASEQGGRVWPTSFAEPFTKLVTQGMVHGKTYSDPATGRFLKPGEVNLDDKSGPIIRASGVVPHVSFEKMSKSKYNGTDPALCIDRFGADVTRAHILFAAPESEVLDWEEERIVGMTRWLTRVWRLVGSQRGRLSTLTVSARFSGLSQEDRNLLTELKCAQDSVDDKLSQAAGLNTVVSDLIKLTNALESYVNLGRGQEQAEGEKPAVLTFCLSSLVRLMAPLTPAFSEECWQRLHTPVVTQGDLEPSGSCTSLFDGSKTWPSIPVVEETVQEGSVHTFVVSVNGKPKFTSKLLLARVPTSNAEDMQQWLVDNVFSSAEGQRWLTSVRNHELLDARRSIFHKQVSGRKWVVNVLT